MNLFQKGSVRLNSGKLSDFKIDCDALSDEDIDCIAYLISEKVTFKKVIGVPRGGIRLEKALERYCLSDVSLPIIICDDVLATGGSMERFRIGVKENYPNDAIFGVVIFARDKHEDWIDSLFKINL